MIYRSTQKLYFQQLLVLACTLINLVTLGFSKDKPNIQKLNQGHPEYQLKYPEHKRSDIVLPFMSFLLPGLDQWLEGQYKYGAIYTGGSLLSLEIASQNKQEYLDKHNLAKNSKIDVNQSTKDVNLRSYALGHQTYMALGGVSAFHSFRSAVSTRKLQGEYTFLDNSESIEDILLAPFKFSFLKRTTTWMPLAIASAFGALMLSNSDESLAEQNFKRSEFQPIDGMFASMTSYNAGVWEEAVFRGWLMPIVKEYTGSSLLSNTLVSSLFSLGHLSSENQFPIMQLISGLYLGYLTEKRGWSLSESIFVHTWWDVIIFSAMYHLEKTTPNELPPLMLPTLEINF